MNKKKEATIDAIPDLMLIVDKEGYFIEYLADHVVSKGALSVNKIIDSHLHNIFSSEEVALQLAIFQKCIESENIQRIGMF